MLVQIEKITGHPERSDGPRGMEDRLPDDGSAATGSFTSLRFVQDDLGFLKVSHDLATSSLATRGSGDFNAR
jgi:hypothetical protein